MTCNKHRSCRRLGLFLVIACVYSGLAAAEEPLDCSPLFLIADASGENIYIADQTGSRIIQLDIKTQKVVRRISHSSRPNGLALDKDSHGIYATGDADAGGVFHLDASSGVVLKMLPAGHSPIAPVLSSDGSTLYVCHRFTGDLSVIDLKTGKERKRIALGREPVAAALAPDGAILAVANLHGNDSSDGANFASTVHLIDTNTNEIIEAVRLPPGGIGARGICFTPDGRYVLVTHVLARNHVPATQLASGWLNTHSLSILDVGRRELVGTVLLDDAGRGAAGPWGVACTADGRQVCVALAGTHELCIIDLPGTLERLREFHQTHPATAEISDDPYARVETPYTDLTFLRGLKRRFPLQGKGPRHLVIVGDRAYVGMYFSGTVEVVDLTGATNDSQAIALVPEVPPSRTRRGEQLFNDASIAFQGWQSCNSCHPDGRSDGLNWDLTNDGVGNAKNAKSLLFADKTPPLTLAGIFDSLDECVRFELKTILFTRIPDEDAAAIVDYLASLRPVPSPHLEGGHPSASAVRGKVVFDKARCHTCHDGEYFTNFQKKNVGTNVLGDQRKTFDIPGLDEIWRTAPYLHDGRAATLHDVVTRFNPTDRHGKTSHLSDEEIADLVAYVLSL